MAVSARPATSTPSVVVSFFAFQIVIPMLYRNISITTTMASFTGIGCSSSLFPSVQPNRYPTTAVTPAEGPQPELPVGEAG